MKKFRKVQIVLIALIMIMQVALPTITYAADTMKLNIQYERPHADDDNNGTVGDDVYTITTGSTEQTVFKIGEQSTSAADVLEFAQALYCLRGGLGFGSTDEIVEEGVDYTLLANLKTEKAEVIEYYKNIMFPETAELTDEQSTALETIYNGICWIADNMYIVGDENSAELKNELLSNAGIVNSELTDDDIEVVQQLALWYFSNYDQNGVDSSVSIADTQVITNLIKINSENLQAVSATRYAQMTALYNYFITGAKSNAETYNPTPEIIVPNISIDKTTTPTIVEEGTGVLAVYKVGPFSIVDSNETNIDYQLDIKLLDANGVEIPSEYDLDTWTSVVYEVVRADRDETISSLEETVNEGNFYIKINKVILEAIGTYDVSKVTMDLDYSYSYFTTDASLWVATEEDQPVLKVEKTKISDDGQDTFDTSIPVIGEFELNINKVDENGTLLAGATFELQNENRETINLTNNEDGTFTTEKIDITSEGQTFIYELTESKSPDGYIGLAEAVKIKIVTGLNDTEDAYVVKEVSLVDGEGNTITSNVVTLNMEENTVTVEIKNTPISGSYNINLVKIKQDTDTKLAGIKFDIEYIDDEGDTAKKTITTIADLNEIIENRKFTKENETHTYTITEQEEPTDSEGNKYKRLAPVVLEVTSGLNDAKDAYVIKEVALKDTDGNVLESEQVKAETSENSTLVTVTLGNVEKEKEFDLALRKYITAISGETLEEAPRNPETVTDNLDEGYDTAEYNHKKDPVLVKTDDVVTYKITIYNEGEIAGRATKVVDQLPTGLEFVEVVSGDYELDSYDKETNKLTLKEKAENKTLNPYKDGTLDSTTIEINCKVVATAGKVDKVLTNVAWISEDIALDSDGNELEIEDRDSKPEENPNVNKNNMEDYKGLESNKDDLTDSDYFYKGEQDDDDFEKLIIKGYNFDLSLRKFITTINGEEVEVSRVPEIDTTNLLNGKDTAKYTHSKEPITVRKGDIVTYTIRVYNEGDTDGYATEITDYLPEGLGLLLNYKENTDNLWTAKDIEDPKTMALVGENGFYKDEKDVKNLKLEDFNDTESLSDVYILTGKTAITSTLLKDELIKKYDSTVTDEDERQWQQSTNGEDGLYYKDVEVTCIVLAENTYQGILKNIAEISDDKAVDDEDEEIKIDDRDSTPDDVDIDDYDAPEDNSEYQEDDDDYEPIQLKYFDLALRKFITGVNDEKVITRIPTAVMGEDGNIKYEHDKTPVYVANSDYVTYTIRVYNEGTIAGYAEEIADDIPEGLVFVPESETNKKYGWVMLDKDGNVTENVEEAVEVRTDYLSEAKGKEQMKDNSSKNPNLLEAFDSKDIVAGQTVTPDYRDVEIVFQVIEKKMDPDEESRIITNKAQITEDSDDDEDSTPDEWNDDEDDQDEEHVYVKCFDLSLLKWVTKTIVTVDGKTTTTETGFKPNQGLTEIEGQRDNKAGEPIAKVEIDKKKLNKTTVKFVYNIRVSNEGEIDGQATEITDFIPEGLEFYEEDNKQFGWVKSGDDKVTTNALDGLTLQAPIYDSEGNITNEEDTYAVLQIVFRWKNDEKNLGLKTNIAEITEDYNEKDSPDVDSTPDNIEDEDEYRKVDEKGHEQEDDDDYALVILSLKTGNEKTYTLLALVVITIIAGGAVLIKKYVL